MFHLGWQQLFRVSWDYSLSQHLPSENLELAIMRIEPRTVCMPSSGSKSALSYRKWQASHPSGKIVCHSFSLQWKYSFKIKE